MSYSPIHVHSYYSILDGFGSPKANVTRAKSLGLPALGMTDHGNVFGHIDFWSQCKKAGIKPILGCELYIVHQPAVIRTQENRQNCHMVCWAKNKDGWLNLLKLVSKTNDPDYYYYKPRISLFSYNENGKIYPGLEDFVGPDRGIMSFSGHQGSHLSDNLFCDLFSDGERRRTNIKRAYGRYKERDIGFYRKFLKENWLESTSELALKFEKMFGRGNFFIELQNELNSNDKLALWIHPLIVECLREVSKQTGIPAIASSDPHYPSKEDAQDQRLMVMTNMKETEESVQQKLDSSDEQDVMVFFGSDNFYIHSYEEMKQKFTDEELAMTIKIANEVELYDILHKPYIPQYDIPEFDDKSPHLNIAPSIEDKYLMHLCIEGAKKLKPWNDLEWAGKRKITKEEYWNRLINEEFPTIFKARLSSYFLVVWDYCMAADFRPADYSFDWRKNLNENNTTDPIPRGVGRGSAAGCLVSYLIGITGIDPILYDLSFSRFYNEGRNTSDHVELPDIDVDFAVEDRDWIIAYLENKYGKDKVAQIITFQRIQGRAAVKDIFRVKGVEGGFDLSNQICKFIPNEAEIADEIQTMREAGHESYGILQWALDNSDELQEYYQKPELKALFDQAVRCEGKKRGCGRHPSGVIVVSDPVEECFPMALDTKTKEKIIGVDFNDVAKLGGIKYDILGTAILDKLKMTQDLVNDITPRRNRINNYLEPENEEAVI